MGNSQSSIVPITFWLVLSLTAHGLGVISMVRLLANAPKIVKYQLHEVDFVSSNSHSHRRKSKASAKVKTSALEETFDEADTPSKSQGVVSTTTYQESEVDSTAKVLTSPRLRYPKQAYREGVEGAVELFLLIDEQGNVTQQELTRTAGYGFDEAALDAAKQLKFTPAQKDGKPVRVHLHWTIHFKMDG